MHADGESLSPGQGSQSWCKCCLNGKAGELRFDVLSAGEVRLSTIIDAVSLGRPYKTE